ncbi:MAG: hypothetical protein SF162_01250 [bacterium]|nr:hypothetical protein [bacterium]
MTSSSEKTFKADADIFLDEIQAYRAYLLHLNLGDIAEQTDAALAQSMVYDALETLRSAMNDIMRPAAAPVDPPTPEPRTDPHGGAAEIAVAASPISHVFDALDEALRDDEQWDTPTFGMPALTDEQQSALDDLTALQAQYEQARRDQRWHTMSMLEGQLAGAQIRWIKLMGGDTGR